MSRFENILVYVDRRPESLYGLERATNLAKAHGARLKLMRVLGPIEDERWIHSEDAGARQIREAITEENRTELDRDLPVLLEEGVFASTEVCWGTPFLEILREVDEGGHDLVIKTAARRREDGAYQLGAVAMHLIRKCPCPVWIKVPKALPSRRVLALVGPGGEDPASQAFNRSIVDLAAKLATGIGATWEVVRFWENPFVGLARGVEGARPEDDGDVIRAVAAAASRDLAHAVEHRAAELDPQQIRLLRGESREDLPRLVAEEGFDVVVMGSVDPRSDPKILISEAAEAVLQRIQCSVLVTKPQSMGRAVS